MSELRHIRPGGLANNPAYTHVVAARGAETVFVSGQVALDADGQLVGAGDLGAQTTQVMRNLETALAAAGATFADVTKITTFVVDYQPGHRAVIAEARGQFLPSANPPASTLVGVTALATPDFLIEIEATAVVG
ncbi:MAG: RidA family protein [Actinomycetia bacterium]|nr:RidA family protein [Actinomycetes bacterium]